MSEPGSVDYLSVEDLVEIAEGVIGSLVVRDHGLLVSAAARPQTTVLGRDAYPTFAEKAAALMHSLARNHALVDGNKRLAWAATRVFCLLNGRDLGFDVDQAEALVVAVASGETDVPQIAERLEAHVASQDRGDRFEPATFRPPVGLIGSRWGGWARVDGVEVRSVALGCVDFGPRIGPRRRTTVPAPGGAVGRLAAWRAIPSPHGGLAWRA